METVRDMVNSQVTWVDKKVELYMTWVDSKVEPECDKSNMANKLCSLYMIWTKAR